MIEILAQLLHSPYNSIGLISEMGRGTFDISNSTTLGFGHFSSAHPGHDNSLHQVLARHEAVTLLLLAASGRKAVAELHIH